MKYHTTRTPSPSPALSALQMPRASPVCLCVACSSMFDDDEAGGLLFHVCHSLALLPCRNQLVHPSLPFFGQCADPSPSSPSFSFFCVTVTIAICRPLLLPSLALLPRAIHTTLAGKVIGTLTFGASYARRPGTNSF